jgi:Ca-activated chloride channel homolog
MLTLFSFLCALGCAQPPADGQPQRFTSSSDLVVLHVTVLDRDAQYVAGLPRDAFTIAEDGRPQSISFFEAADSAVTVGLVIDSSISMHRKRAAVIAAGSTFIESSHPDDEMFTINFNERVWPGLEGERRFSGDRAELRRALDRSGARGRTALFDALRAALGQLAAGQRQKKVLIVISDGGDNASTTRFEDVLEMALRMNAVIYSVAIEDEYNREGNKDVLRKLAAVSGGATFFLKEASEAPRALEQIAREIRSGYVIGYVPADASAGYHAVRVKVRAPDRRKVSVRARSGYVSGGPR